jgi:hypothetical protein
MALAGSCVVVGIMEAPLFSGSVNDTVTTQIAYGLAVAANVVVTTLTGKSVYSIVHRQCWKPCSAGRILWTRRAASHVGLDRTLRNRYNTAIGIMYDLLLYCLSPDMFSRLESGAIYYITVIVLGITSSLDLEIYHIELGVVQQLIVSPISSHLTSSSNLPIFQNIIPMFTLAYVGLKNTDYSQHIHQVPSTHHASSRSAVVRPCEPCEVLDIKPHSTEEKDSECVWDDPHEWWFCIILIIASTISDKVPIFVNPSRS